MKFVFLVFIFALGTAWAEDQESDRSSYFYDGFNRPQEDILPSHSKSIEAVSINRLIESETQPGTYLRGGQVHGSSGRWDEERARRRKLNPSGLDIKIDLEIPCLVCRGEDSVKTVGQDVDQLQVGLLCGSDFDKNAWDRETPEYSKLPSKTLSLSQAKRYLERFAKPGGYNEKDYSAILNAISLNPEVVKLLKKELFFALQMISLESDSFEFTTSGLDISDLAPIPPYMEDDVCRSPKEIAQVRKQAGERALLLASKVPNEEARSLGEWESVILLIPSLNKLPAALKTEVKNKLYRTLASGAVVFDFPGLFPSKALLFTKSYVNKLFGDPAKEFTELTATNRENTSYYLLGTSPMQSGGQPSSLGFYGIESVALRGPQAPAFNQIKESTLSWSHQGETYSAKVKLSGKDAEKLIHKSQSPDYDKMWSNKKMSGVVLLGDNLGDFKAKTTDQYIHYYGDKGFKFEEPKNLTDSKAWLKDHISDGTVDYFIKEAHSGGNTSNLISFSQKQKLLRGTRTLANGKLEEVFILAPGSETDGPQEKLTYPDMKDWMKKRRQEKQGPMLYLNSACWSMDQARNEIPAIENPLFVDIPADSRSTTFINSPGSTKYHIIEGIRGGKTYKEIRQGMETTERYKAGRNRFQFPDEENYQESLSHLTEVRIDIKNSKGKAYSLEEAAH